MFTYEKDGSDYLCRGLCREILWESPEVSVAFSLERDTTLPIIATLHKIGRPESVERWVKESKSKLIKQRDTLKSNTRSAKFVQEMINDLKIITSSEWDPEDLNKFLNITGYLGKYIKDNDLLPLLTAEDDIVLEECWVHRTR